MKSKTGNEKMKVEKRTENSQTRTERKNWNPILVINIIASIFLAAFQHWLIHFEYIGRWSYVSVWKLHLHFANKESWKWEKINSNFFLLHSNFILHKQKTTLGALNSASLNTSTLSYYTQNAGFKAVRSRQ